MIKAYFVQHGIAESPEVDDKRPLSSAGADEVRRIASHLNNHGIEIKRIHHSGKLRAIQTATIFSETLAVDDISELDGMNPNDDPKAFIDQITDDAILFVGHLPHIQTVVSTIISGEKNSSTVKFQNSAVACVEIHNGQGSLQWFINPGLCR